VRVTRASVVTAVLAGSAICAGPLVGVALAKPALQSSSPPSGSLITDPTKVPTVVSATYDKALYSPTSPVFPSHVTVKRNNVAFACTAGISSDMKTLTCTPDGATKFPDGTYDATFLASPAPGIPSDTTPSTDHVLFTIDTTPPTLAAGGRTPTPDSRVQPPSSVVATYQEQLDSNASTLTVTDSLNNVVGGSSVVTNPTCTSGVVTWHPDGALANGVTYTATSNVTDLHGLTSTTTWQFVVDNQPPAVPTVNLPTYVNIANQHDVPITGTADNSTGGATAVRVTAAQGLTTVTLPDVNVGNGGTWNATSVADLSSLADGAVTITARAIDAAGNISAASADQTSTKDTVAPSPAPTVAYAQGVVVNAANPTLAVHGVTENGAGVAVVATDSHNHSTSPVTTTADNSNGGYSAVVDTSSLDDGTLTITSTATDAAGNTSSGSNTISKDATPPGTPTITVFDPVNANTNTTTNPVSGTAPSAAGTTVNVWLTDSSEVPTAEVDNIPVDGAGNWSTAVDVTSLSSGPVTAHARSFDASHNPSAADGTLTTVKDVAAPDTATYTAPAWINAADASALDMSGTAEPGTSLHLVATDSGTGTKTVDLPVESDGTWATTLDLHTFAEGAVNFVATITDAAGNVSAASYAYAYYLAVDENHNFNIEQDELLSFLSARNIDVDNPASPVNQIASDFRAPRTHEVVVGLDHELMANFGVSANYTWRRYVDVLWPSTEQPPIGVTSADYLEDGRITGTLPDGTPFDQPYYALRADRAPRGNGTLTANREGYHQTFHGIEVAATKRLANRWMSRVGFSWNDHKEYFDDPSKSIVDPTPVSADPRINGATVTFPTAGSGKSQIYLTLPKYQLTANGFYQGPWGLNLGANFVLRQGYSEMFFANDVGTNDPVYNTKDVLVVGTPGKYRLPTVRSLDARVEKEVSFGRARVAFDVDVFNALNSGTVLGRKYDVEADTFNDITEIMNPRIVRFGVRLQF